MPDLRAWDLYRPDFACERGRQVARIGGNLNLFWLVFRRDAFLPDAADERTFHERAIEEGRFHQERSWQR